MFPIVGTAHDDEDALRRLTQQAEDAINAGDLDGLMQFYGDVYVDVNLREPVQSHDERRTYYASVLFRPDVRVRLHADEIVVHGHWALVRGTILIRPSADPGEAPRELRYMEWWERNRAGEWRVRWGMDGPVQESLPAK